jgi:hypothetical protein
MDEETLERFMLCVDKQEDGCWLWTGAKAVGYGVMKLGGRKGKLWYSHRLMFLHHYGHLTPGLDVAHSCRNKCVNPEHLSEKTRKDNQIDRVRDGTTNRGERQGRAVLTDKQVRAIRECVNQTQQQIADEFGVSRTTISYILTNKRWQHII